MLKKILPFLIMLLLIVGCSKPDAYDSTGKPVQLLAYKGKWVVINYWATWCEPCVKELPELNNLYLRNKDKLVVLGVNFDRLPNAELKAVADKFNLEFPLLSQLATERYDIQHVETLPITFLINPQGKLQEILHGPQTERSILARLN